MKALVIYDSTYGNTEKIAQAIAETIDCQVMQASEVSPADLHTFDLLVFGSPTHGGFQSEAIDGFLKTLSPLKGVKAAAFDTRTKRTIFGYAAPKIARKLEKLGYHLLVPAEGFFVLGTEGPLLEGELERAVIWAKHSFLGFGEDSRA